MWNQFTYEDFIKKAKEVHRKRYGYEFSVYINAHTPVIIVCDIHGRFSQTPNNHLYNRQGCPVCARGGTNEERFWSHVIRGEEFECWNWTASLSHNDYGRFWLNGKTEPAHRYSYQIHYGEIKHGFLVLHHCDNPKCVNPAHLYSGTTKDNAQDMVRRGRQRDQHGEKNSMSKLTENDVIEIRKMIQDGYMQRDIAKEFGVSDSSICDIKKGRHWAWLK